MTVAPTAEPGVDTSPRLLAGFDPRRTLGLQEHFARYGRPVPARDLISELEAAGLRGRGGAAFPVAAKVRAVASRRRRPVVVINAAEGEPLSFKDKLLIGRLPHLVIDGAVMLAAAIGAREVFVAHSEAARGEGAALRTAVAERRHLHDRIEVTAVVVPDGYVTGQETALIHFLNGGRPFRPSRRRGPSNRASANGRLSFRTPRRRPMSRSSRGTEPAGFAGQARPTSLGRLSSPSPAGSGGRACTRQLSELR